ncbi:MAG: TIGR03943 family protein [Anaerolineales bacterium]|nr:TIGR03943 family protein [Anaerolineales bacterium]
MKKLLTIHNAKFMVITGLGLYFAYIYVSGTWAYYIDPRFQWLSVVAVLIFGFLAVSYFGSAEHEHDHHDHDHDHEHSHDHGHDHEHNHNSVWPVLVVAIPLAIGVLMPAKPLGANAIDARGIDTDFSSVSLSNSSSKSLTIVPSERNVLDWARAFATSTNPAEFNDQEASVIGFVYRDGRFDDGHFMVARFTITCCVADALAIGVVVKSPEDAAVLATDSWVKVQGHFQETEFDGNLIPILYAEKVTPVEQPDQPYLYQ